MTLLNIPADISGCGFFPSDKKTREAVTCTAPSAVIVSPKYPLLYENGLDREWRIRTSVGTYISVTFKEFNISSPTAHCEEDYLEFISGNTKTRLCNANIDEHEWKFNSDKNDIKMYLSSNYDLKGGLFFATYEERSFTSGSYSKGEIILKRIRKGK